MVRCENVMKQYNGKMVLNDVNMYVRKGEVIALIGPSGSGKTTLLRTLNGFAVPDSGNVFINGEKINYKDKESLRQLRKKIGMIYQLFNLVERTSAIVNVMAGALGRLDKGIHLIYSTIGLFNKKERTKAMELLKFVGIEDKAFERVDRLSGGQKQRVAIARALMQDPELILADEPIANLDPKTSERILELLLRINQEKNITLICVLHHLDMVKDYFNRVVALKDGSICFDGNIKTFSQREASEIYGFEKESKCIAL